MPQKICAVCFRPLDSLRIHSQEIWAHAPSQAVDDDHIPVPVDSADRQTRRWCDFCNTDPAVGLLPVAGAISTMRCSVSMNQSWAVCAACQNLISADEWDDLIHRIAEKFAPLEAARGVMGQSLLGELSRMVRQIRTQVTGPIEPIDDSKA